MREAPCKLARHTTQHVLSHDPSLLRQPLPDSFPLSLPCPAFSRRSCMTLMVCVMNVLVAHAPKLPECLTARLQSGSAEASADTLKALCGEQQRLIDA
jgi:hypothetical protein